MTDKHTGPPRKILIVDDDAGVLGLVMRWLSEAGLEVVTCQTVETARVCLDAWRPDVLLTDVRVEATNGIYLAVLAKQRVPPVRCIVMSGFDDPVLVAEASAQDARFLAKPVSRELLLAAVLGTQD